MDFLIRGLLPLLLLTVSFPLWASGEDPDPDPRALAALEQAKALCYSSEEYIATLKFLRKSKEILVPEGTARRISEKVAGGCDGAAGRFAHILVLLKTVGLSDRKALQMALEFAGHSPDVQRNFSEIFSRAFMDEFFDYEYGLAVRLAYELSKDYGGEPAQVRDDFLDLVKFCKADKSLALPNKICAELSIKLARLSLYFPNGVREPFYQLFKELRERRDFSLNIKTALDVAYNVLKNGPRAPENFFKGFQFALAKDGLALDSHQALAFALKLAQQSFTGEKPPILRALPALPSRMANASNP